MEKKKFSDRQKGNAFLLCAALVWGGALVAQKAGMDYLGPFGFTAIRCILGGVSMLPIVFFLEKKKQRANISDGVKDGKRVFVAALVCGFFLALLILFQQFGLPYTTVGKAGFITALYIIITPILEKLTGKQITKFVWIGAGIAMLGMYLLCVAGGLSGFTFGDVMMLCAALGCSLQVIAIDKCVKYVEPVKLSCYQFLVAGVLCIPGAIIFETVTWQAVCDCMLPILYAGFISCGIGYTFQVIGQKYTPPSQATLLLSLETVFSLFAGMIFFGEIMTVTEYVGCCVMFIAILISQRH